MDKVITIMHRIVAKIAVMMSLLKTANYDYKL